jgi:putative two-component system response regulator
MQTPAEDLSSARILIIDDEEPVTRLLAGFLQAEGFHAIERLTDPKEAAWRFLEFQPDLITLDLHMPEIDGFEVMRRIFEISGTQWVPIIVVSGDGDSDQIVRALKLGAMDFIVKPFRKSEIMNRLRNTIRVKLLQKSVERRNEELELRVAERTRDLELAHFDVVRRLAMCAEYRDDESGNHVRRVSTLAEKLGATMGMDVRQAEILRHATTLHDVGKVAVRDSILLKPGRLTPEEHELMQEHTVKGAAVLEGAESEVLKMAARIALCHHERWDGKGYPAGLAGKDIPFEARVVAICDVFDALTSRRPYKAAWESERAWEELRAQSGRQFDPEVVDAFLSIREEAERIVARYRDAGSKPPSVEGAR